VFVYVPNSSEGLRRLEYRTKKWDQDLFDYMQALEKSGNKPVILAGDLNVAYEEIDIYDTTGKEKVPGFTPEERESFGGLLGRGFIDTFRYFNPGVQKFSFWSARQNLRKQDKGWRLDYFVISESAIKNVVSSEIEQQFYGSDHCPILLTLKFDGE